MKTNLRTAAHQIKKSISATLIALFLILSNVHAQCPTPPGNPVVYGSAAWIGYVYSGLDTNNPPLNACAAANYKGYLNESELFDHDYSTGSVSGSTICGSYSDSFSIRYRMQKTFVAGYYTITIGGDDGVRLSTDGGSTFAISDWGYHAYQTTTATLYLSGSTNMVLEAYDQGGQFRISFSYTFCPGYSTAPTSISGTTAICSGNSTTLTATGGTAQPGVTYQWGTGSAVGSNSIPGQTSASMTVGPTANTIYWVRRIDGSPCTNTTSGATQAVTVTPVSTAPTTLTGTGAVCLGTPVTLTASGGTLATGSAYEWGTGVTGSNIISGQSLASITVTPTATTTYWVRRVNAYPCTTPTSAVAGTITVNVPAGDQTSYGANSWIGYVYADTDSANPPSNVFTTNYRGYITQTEQFNQDISSGSLSGPNLCSTYADRFSIRFKMQRNFTAGYYTFTVGGDDGYRLSLDGGTSFPISNWTDHAYQTTTSSTYYLSGNTNLVLEYYEAAGASQVSFSYVACTDFSTAPIAISGTAPICNGSSATLTATGGYAASASTYQWGTGPTVGSNVIAGTTASITVSPSSTTTYWVRRVDGSPCNLATGGPTQTITVTTPSTAPIGISASASTICSGTSTTLTATGGTLAAGGSYQWGTGSTPGSNIITGQTASTLTVTPSATTTYWVRRVDAAPCNTPTSGPTSTVTVSAASTGPTSITGITSLCYGSGGTTLTAVGATAGSSSTYQWGTGTVGSNIIGGASTNTLYINPNATMTYWVRMSDGWPCNSYTAAATLLINVSNQSTAPTSISNTSTICSNGGITLTAIGGTAQPGSTYQWGTGYTTGANIIAGETASAMFANPSVNTVYWVRRVDPAPCSTQTGGPTISVTVVSTAPTSITSAANPLCYGTGGTTLTANGGISATSGTTQFQWGTGSVIGSNAFGGTVNTQYVNPTTTTTYWVRRYDPAPCNSYTTGVTFTLTVNTASTSPASITGTTSICNGGSTTLTASGGTVGAGATYQWGTGYTLGSNTIAGQTGISMTVSPTTNTVYWVRRVDPAPCNTATGGPTVTVSVTNPSTAPTAITGAGAASCPGTSKILTANGTLASGANYQWGTGSVIGSNVIAGQTSASITVSPAATTIYWVRIYDAAAPCNYYTSGVTTTVSVSAPPGDPTVFGTNTWNAYGYSTGDITLATAVYSGYYTQSTLGFDTTASWNNTVSPSSAPNWNGCSVPVDNFTFVYKRQGFPCGTYTLTMLNWDDEAQLYIDGVQRWSCMSWSGAGACTGVVGSFNLTSTSTVELRVREYSGGANAALSITQTSIASTAPTSITGTTATCSGTSTTLTASGGTAGTNVAYEWGTGSVVGSNIITGQTTSALTVTPVSTTTYWVRRTDTVCGTSTGGVTQAVSVAPATVAGTLTAAASIICRSTLPGSISLSGQTGSVVKWQYASDAAFTTGVTDISSTATTLPGSTIGTLSETRYFRAVVQNSGCSTLNTTAIAITVPTAITYNGTWGGTPDVNTPVIINSSLALSATLNVCSCRVKNNATLTVNSGQNLIVRTSLTVDSGSNIIVEDTGSIVQTEDAATDTGSITVKRKSQPMKNYDYTYWSSPVAGWRLNQLSPNTTPDKYYYYNPAIANWVSVNGGTLPMDAAKGYIIRAPIGWAVNNASSGVFAGTFTGVPNNGVVPVTIQKSASSYNLIGNPYPSAINIDDFITDASNAGIVNGTVYLWTHNTAISSTITGNWTNNYTADDYAKYNLTGGIRSASPALTGGQVPTGYIASGQGFFIEANSALVNGSYIANFRNSMRVASHNSGFYRPGAPSSGHDDATKHRLWITMTNTQGAYNEILIGYLPGATNGFDSLYDGKILPGANTLAMYTFVDDNKLSIQGRTLPFDINDVIPVGYKSTLEGDFTIGLENFDGLFAGQDVFLVDHETNTVTNLKTSSYNFNTATGTFDARFEIQFTNMPELAVSSQQFNADDVRIIAQGKQAVVRATKNIKSVEVYDLLGRRLFAADKINAREFRTAALSTSEQVLIVKATVDGNYEKSQKIIVH